MQAQQVLKCLHTSRKCQEVKANPFFTLLYSMVLEFWFQNICLSRGSQPSQKENILQVKVCGVVTFATHPRPQDKGHHSPKAAGCRRPRPSHIHLILYRKASPAAAARTAWKALPLSSGRLELTAGKCQKTALARSNQDEPIS